MIRLQTAAGRDIPNVQQSEISAFERNWATTLGSKFPAATFRTQSSAKYNCHGLTLASRRVRVWDPSSVRLVLADDGYKELAQKSALAGDLVVYFSNEGDPSHSGFVVANEPPLYNPLIVSKWGSGPEVVHRLFDVPNVYGQVHRFFRCRL